MPAVDPFADPREVYGADVANFDPVNPRDYLMSHIADMESQGYKVPHFIGRENEPEGDRGPTMDMESLINALRQKQIDVAGDKEQSKTTRKDLKYWENEVKKGMSADQWKKQTGESDPVGQRLYGSVNPDLPGQVAGGTPRVVLGGADKDWRDIPGLVELGNMDITRIPVGVPRPSIHREGDRYVVAPFPGNIEYNFGKFMDPGTAMAYAEKIAHDMDISDEADKIQQEGGTEYARGILNKDKTPLKGGQYRGPIGEFPQPLSRKQWALHRVMNFR